MFGTNSANRKQPVWDKVKGGSTYKIDGDLYNLNWVDWNNDRHQDGWLTYMNVGEESWRTWIESRIAHVIDRFGVDAYFLDIVGGHVNSTTGDMHEGTKKMILNLRAKYPKVACVGEMPISRGFWMGSLGGDGAGSGAGVGRMRRDFERESPSPSAPFALN